MKRPTEGDDEANNYHNDISDGLGERRLHGATATPRLKVNHTG